MISKKNIIFFVLIINSFIGFSQSKKQKGLNRIFDENGTWIGNEFYSKGKLDSSQVVENGVVVFSTQYLKKCTLENMYVHNKVMEKKYSSFTDNEILEVSCNYDSINRKFICDTLLRSDLFGVKISDDNTVIDRDNVIVIEGDKIITTSESDKSDSDNEILSRDELMDSYLKYPNDIVYDSVDLKPKFMNGEEDMRNFVKIFFEPNKSKMTLPVKDKVIVEFVVRFDGVVTDIQIIKKVNPEVDKSAIYVVKQMRTWKPGIRNGKNVSVRCKLPIDVNLE